MKTVILYDSLCALCNQSVRIVKRLDWLHRFIYSDIQDWESVHARHPQLDREATLSAMHIVRPDGKIYAGYEAIRQISRELPLFFWVYPLLYLPGVTWIGPDSTAGFQRIATNSTGYLAARHNVKVALVEFTRGE